ncbi:bolA 2 [Sigmodon hispidus]
MWTTVRIQQDQKGVGALRDVGRQPEHPRTAYLGDHGTGMTPGDTLAPAGLWTWNSAPTTSASSCGGDQEAEHVEVEDTTHNRCATSFRVLVVSAKFEEKPLLQRHRLVNECLAEELPRIHAFERKTLAPEQWTREQRR